MLRQRPALCGLALMLFSVAAHGATIGGKTYETTGGSVYLVDGSGEYWRVVPDLIEIKFEANISASARDSFLTANDLTETPFLLSDDYLLYRYPLVADPLDVLDAVLSWEYVENALLNFENKELGDPYFEFEKQWNLFLVNVDRALEVTRGVSDVVVAIHDAGVDHDHADLSSTRWVNPNDSDDDDDDDDDDESWFGFPLRDDSWGWNFDAQVLFEGDTAPWPVTEHGTPVAGIVAATNDNSEGIASPGGGSSTSRPVRWLSVVGRTSTTFALAVDYCRHKMENGASRMIINQSFKIVPEQFGNKRPGVDAVRAFAAAGGLVVAAAGNNCEDESQPEVGWPASIDSVLAVGAVDSLLHHWDYSCDGPEVDLVAPAGYWQLATPDSAYHWSTDNYEYDQPEFNPGVCDCAGRVTDETYTLFGGTSAATPLVSGIAALEGNYWGAQGPKASKFSGSAAVDYTP